MRRGIRLAITTVFMGLILFCIAMAVWAFIRQSDTEGIAREAFDLINEHRTEGGYSPLVWDEQLAELATKHSEHMKSTIINLGRFALSSHTLV